jgi:hypothetical protein
MKTFVAKVLLEYYTGYRYTLTLRVEATDKKNAIREIKNYCAEKCENKAVFNIIYINEI